MLPLRNAIVCFHPDDERVLFALPWGDSTYIGTTDTDYDGDPAEAVASGEDVDYLIRAAEAYFPNYPIRYADIHSTWAGLRPLVHPQTSKATDESSVSREHHLDVSADGLITIAGGKLTTYRRMCEEVVDTAIRLLQLRGKLTSEVMRKGITDESVLPGAVGWPADDDEGTIIAQIIEESGGAIEADTATLFVQTYGMRGLELAAMVKEQPQLAERLLPERPEILAQVDFGVNQEFACTVSDILKQRTQIYYRDANQGLDAIDKVAARMATLLGWDHVARQRHADAYRADVAKNRRWKDEVSSTFA